MINKHKRHLENNGVTSMSIDEVKRMLQFAKKWGLDPEYVLDIVWDLRPGLGKYDRLDDLMQMISKGSEGGHLVTDSCNNGIVYTRDTVKEIDEFLDRIGRGEDTVPSDVEYDDEDDNPFYRMED